MKKLILLFIVLLFAGKAYSQNYWGLDTLNKSVSATTYDTLRLGPGEKSIEVWNKTTGTLNIGFRSALTNYKDTVNIIQVITGQKVILVNRKDSVIFVKSSVTGTVTVTVWYGKGDAPIVYYPFNSSGLPVTTISGNIVNQPDTSLIWTTDTATGAIDTLHRYSSYTLTNLTTKFPNKWQLTITADSTIEISTAIGFTAGLTFKLNTGESWTSTYYSGITTIYIRRHSSIVGTATWRADIHGF